LQHVLAYVQTAYACISSSQQYFPIKTTAALPCHYHFMNTQYSYLLIYHGHYLRALLHKTLYLTWQGMCI